MVILYAHRNGILIWDYQGVISNEIRAFLSDCVELPKQVRPIWRLELRQQTVHISN